MTGNKISDAAIDKTSSYFFISLMNGASWGGSEELWYGTALYLASRGVKTGCAVYDWQEKEQRLKELEKAGCNVFRLPTRKKKKSTLVKNLLGKVQYRIEIKKRIEALPVKNYNTIVINQGGFEIYTETWKIFHKALKKYVLLFHNYEENHIFSQRQKTVLKEWIQNAAINLFATKRIHQVLQKQLSIEIKNSNVFINPITFPQPEQAKEYPSLQNGNFILAMFAALDVYRKAQDKLVKILSAGKWKERVWLLYLYGEGKDKDYLRELINGLGLQHKIVLKGYTSSVALAMEEAHLVLQVSNIDAMPLSVIEAMAIGRPLVVSRIGDMPFWVEEGDNGWVCETDKESIEICLENAWQHRELWGKMGKRSFEIFKKKFPSNPEAKFLEQLNELPFPKK